MFQMYTLKCSVKCHVKIYRDWAQNHVPVNSPVGIALNGLANHKLASKDIKPLVGKSPHHIQSTGDFVSKGKRLTLQMGESLHPMVSLHFLLQFQ